MLEASPKYAELIALYQQMAEKGIDTVEGKHIDHAYGRQEAVKFRGELKRLFAKYAVLSVLDYGAGATPWPEREVPEGGDLLSYTGAEIYHGYEPARGQLERPRCDAVVSFDVLEHVFVADTAYVLHDIFQAATKLVIINVACYPARALLPNGENAHITQRPPQWWLGALTMVSSQYPEIAVALYASARIDQVHRLMEGRVQDVIDAPGFVR